MNFEVVIESIEELQQVNLKSIKSIELCSALQLGGLTPSFATTAFFCEHAVPEIHVMIRPRAGGFIYNDFELQLMVEEIKCFANLGVTGVVFGILDRDLRIERENTIQLLSISKQLDLQTTFHRAFDFSTDHESDLHFLIEVGFDRLLTAGSQKGVDFGLEKLKRWKHLYGEEIQIIAGGGVTYDNAIQLKKNGLEYIHFNIKDPILLSDSVMGCEYKLNLEKLHNLISI